MTLDLSKLSDPRINLPAEAPTQLNIQLDQNGQIIVSVLELQNVILEPLMHKLNAILALLEQDSVDNRILALVPED